MVITPSLLQERQPRQPYHLQRSQGLAMTTLALVIAIAALAIVLWQGNAPNASLFSTKPHPISDSGANYSKNTLVANGFHGMFGNNPTLVADVAEAVAPSVINIDVAKRTRGARSSGSPLQDEFLRRFLGIDPRSAPQERVVQGNGSGFIIDTQGHAITNNHVVEGADELRVTMNDGRKFPATIVGADPYTDLAVIKIQNGRNFRPLGLANSDRIRPGEWVLAVGSPLGFEHSVTIGIISAVSRQVTDINANMKFIQTDAAINPGNSGGPLINLSGEVIGINTAISGRAQNIGFAIPANVAGTVAKGLISSGTVKRPWIGIAMTELTPDLAQSLNMPNIGGVIVSQVLPNGPAHRAGFRQGDVVQKLAGRAVKDAATIQEAVRNKPVGSVLRFEVIRQGRRMPITVRTSELPKNYRG